MRRWGLTIPLNGLPLPAHREIVSELPRLGYTDVWSAETAGTDALSPLVLASQWAPQLRLGTAIVPIYTRGPALLAMSAATLAECAPGRAVLGIGVSSPTIVEQWNSARLDQPYERTRDTLRFLRSALSGTKVNESYATFSVQGFRLERPPSIPPLLMAAALRPGMLRMAAREADGVITNWLAATDVPKIRAVIGDSVELVARVFVCPTTDADRARALGRRMITSYLTVPVYARFQEWLGRGETLGPMHEAWARGERKRANEAIPDATVDELIIHGGIDECREKVANYQDHGVDTPVITLLPTEDDPRELVRALTPPRT
jgi:probable F420-dependent oxidoreductase